MATVPAKTKIAIVGQDNVVSEIVMFDYVRDLVRPDAKFMHHGPDVDAFVQVGWRYVEGVHPRDQWQPPEKKGGA